MSFNSWSAAQHSFAGCLHVSLRSFLGMPATPWVILATLVSALPLYAAGYHDGRNAWIGWPVGVILGACVLTFAAGWKGLERPSLQRFSHDAKVVIRVVGPVLLAFAGMMVAAAWAVERLDATALRFTAPADAAGAGLRLWTPIAHVVVGSLFAFVAAPGVFLAIASSHHGRVAVTASTIAQRPESPMRSVLPHSAMLLLWISWIVLAHVPVLGILLVPCLAAAIHRFVAGGRS
jgi:hypothetical protein